MAVADTERVAGKVAAVTAQVEVQTVASKVEVLRVVMAVARVTAARAVVS